MAARLIKHGRRAYVHVLHPSGKRPVAGDPGAAVAGDLLPGGSNRSWARKWRFEMTPHLPSQRVGKSWKAGA